MRIKIIIPDDFRKLQKEFEDSIINGHIEDAIDGVWFVIDSIERKVRE